MLLALRPTAATWTGLSRAANASDATWTGDSWVWSDATPGQMLRPWGVRRGSGGGQDATPGQMLRPWGRDTHVDPAPPDYATCAGLYAFSSSFFSSEGWVSWQSWNCDASAYFICKQVRARMRRTRAFRSVGARKTLHTMF